jgi:hypothetical protein
MLAVATVDGLFSSTQPELSRTQPERGDDRCGERPQDDDGHTRRFDAFTHGLQHLLKLHARSSTPISV